MFKEVASLAWMQPHRASVCARANKIYTKRRASHLPTIGIFLIKHFGMEGCNRCTEDFARLGVMCQVHSPLPKADAVVCDIDAFAFDVWHELAASFQEVVGTAFARRFLRRAQLPHSHF